MKVNIALEVEPSDVLDTDDLPQFAAAIQQTFEDRYSADPTVSYETGDGEFVFDITSNSTTVTYGTE